MPETINDERFALIVEIPGKSGFWAIEFSSPSIEPNYFTDFGQALISLERNGWQLEKRLDHQSLTGQTITIWIYIPKPPRPQNPTPAFKL